MHLSCENMHMHTHPHMHTLQVHLLTYVITCVCQCLPVYLFAQCTSNNSIHVFVYSRTHRHTHECKSGYKNTHPTPFPLQLPPSCTYQWAPVAALSSGVVQWLWSARVWPFIHTMRQLRGTSAPPVSRIDLIIMWDCPQAAICGPGSQRSAFNVLVLTCIYVWMDDVWRQPLSALYK